eukprot:symbB.v1.2.023696.t1/scaffold2189.1/size92612/6
MDCVSADSLTKVSSELPTETELRQLLQAFPRMMPKLIRRPRGCLALLRALLQHRLREKLFIADAFLELKGFSQCLKAWCHLLDDRLGAETMDDLRGKASEVILELLAQVRRLDNIEALSLALFVECFIGENLGSAVSGGFVMSSGQAVRRVVLSLLRSWSENLKALRALSPLLVGKLWASFASKLRRDAGSHVSREIQVPKGTKVKMEWFKLKPSQTLKKGFGAFHPEELASAVMQFLVAHFNATCERGCEEDPEGILPRSPAEEWTQDVLDRPFGWGVLVPLMVSPPSVATDALKLLEFLVDRHPHQEIVAKRLAGLHSFMPLLSLPWPQADPVESHLPATLGVAMARRSAAKVLQCAMDTDFGMKVARDHLDLCLEGTLHLLHAVLDEPDVLVVMVELLGQLCGLDALQKLPEEWIFRRIHPSVVMVAMLIELRDRDGMMSTVPFHLFVFCHLAMESAAMILPATPAPYPKSVRWQPHKTVPEASLPLTTFERGTSCASGNGNFQRGTSSGLATTRSFGCEVEVRSYGPIHDRMKRRMYLQSFVRANGFKSLHTARGGGCWSGESLYPIHVAVMSGDLELVQMMLNEGVDTEKESSRGRTALDFAKKANVCGSHVEIIKLLEACEAMT